MTRRTAVLRDGSVRTSPADLPPAAPTRVGQDWLAYLSRLDCAGLARAFGLKHPVPALDDDAGPWLTLIDRGVVLANIVVDNDDATPAPRWRAPLRDEPFKTAALLPVAQAGPWGEFGATLSLAALDVDLFAASVVDLIALPLDGSRCLSFTGLTLAVGDLSTDAEGCARLYGGGLAWLRAHLARARKLYIEDPGAPENFATLLVAPQALEWRVSIAECCIPAHAKTLAVVDSGELAGFINAQMRRREQVRRLPTVLGPKHEVLA